jgi:TolB-like protein/Tfp pilus assembly protein PilF
MASIIPGYEYDIFISYRHNDNLDGWVSDFVSNLDKELKGTLKDSVSIYFDTNPHDGLLETHNVEKSLEIKLKCLIFIPVISRTYCEIKSFAWQHEFCAFNKLAREDGFGMDIHLVNGNVTSRILPIKIHDIDNEDSGLLEAELGGVLRAIDFFHKTAGVNRPLTSRDDEVRTPGKILYRDQINKVANVIGEILRGIKNRDLVPTLNESAIPQVRKLPFKKKLIGRGIVRTGLVYILTSVILWKIAVVGSGLLKLDGNSVHLIALILIVLFPIAILEAWFFERSPHGFIRTDSIASLENPFTDARKKPFTSNVFITLLLLTSIALFLLFPMASRTGSIGSIANVEKSIAVLPFDNVRKDPEQEYFSDGMMQEILNHLFKIGGLKISSASSTMKYKDSKLSARSIAREMNVSFVLEGNVSESVNKVRIIVSLINGKTGELIWTQDYKRSMTATDILDIQSDVALEVAARLRVAIDPEVRARIKARPTENTEAYTLFLQARNIVNDDYQKATQMLTRAVSLDPGFADAYAQMAWDRMYYFDDSLTREQIVEKVEPLLNKALELDNNSILAHQALGEFRLRYYWDLKAVENEMQTIVKLNPSNDRRSAFLGYLWDVGKYQEAYEICKDHFEQNNTTAYDWIFMASAYERIGEKQKASETMVTALRLFPHTVYLIRNSIRIFVESGNYKEAIDLFEKELSEKNLHDLQAETLANVATAYYHEGNKTRSKEILMEILSRKENYARSENATSAAQIYVAMGEKDKALQCLEQAYANHELWLAGLNTEPGFMALHGDPRFEGLLHKIGIK